MAKETYQEKLERYYDGNKLTQYPSKRPLRILVLERIASQFQEGVQYSEKEVNTIIRENITFTDQEWIRRELFQYKFMGRLKDGSAYWLEENWREISREYKVEE